MTGVQQGGGVRAGLVPVRGDDHTLARCQAVVFDHPCRLTDGWAEPVQSAVEMGGTVDDLTGGGAHAGGSHHILGKGLGTLDSRGVLGRAETRNTRGADGIGHAESQWHLRADYHQICAQPGSQRGGLIS